MRPLIVQVLCIKYRNENVEIVERPHGYYGSSSASLSTISGVTTPPRFGSTHTLFR
jgi:hypothetical protein